MSAQVNWQWQLTGTIDLTVDASVFDIDLFINSASVVTALHANGRRAICYISVGTYENGRPDSARFSAAVKGLPLADYPDEQWLDIRRLDELGPILEARFDLCKQKGFDGVEPDNVDAFNNNTGFPLTAQDQLRFNQWIANAAHARGLSVGLKNDLVQAKELQPYFDWAINEECFQYNECALLKPFLDAGKAVLNVEYALDTTAFCPQANALNINAMRKNLDLDAPRTPCRTVSNVSRIAAIANAASYSTNAVSPGLIVTIFGTDLKKILFDGVEAPVIYNVGYQTSVVVPYAVAGRSSTGVQTDNGVTRSDVFSIPVAAAAPAVFTLDASGSGAAAMLNQDGTINAPSRPAPCGTVVTFFATGEGQTDPSGVTGKISATPLPRPLLPVTVQIGGMESEVTYGAAAPGMIAGVLQVNARVPCTIAASGVFPLTLKIGTFTSQNTVTMAVKKN